MKTFGEIIAEHRIRLAESALRLTFLATPGATLGARARARPDLAAGDIP